MIINNFVVAYLTMMVISLGLVIPAAAAGLLAARKWNFGMTSDTQDQVEKKAYLVITLLCLGFSLQLFMIPLWFFTLQSLIPYIPGAMCMAGVHLLGAPFSFIATILKFFIPLAYIYWLVLNSLDRRIEIQPFMTLKLRLILPLGIFMLASSCLDASFLHSIKPRIVSCCTTLFDVPRLKALQLVRHGDATWMFLFCLFMGVTLAMSLVRSGHRMIIKTITAVSSLMALVSLVLVLQTKVSPVILETPYHQCLFCLWQNFPDIALASAAVIVGLWLTLICALIPDVQKHPPAAKLAEKISQVANLLSSAGTGWLIMRYAIKYFSGID